MNGISYENMDWVLGVIAGAKSNNDKNCQINGGPLCFEIMEELKEKGYDVKSYSDFNVISWR